MITQSAQFDDALYYFKDLRPQALLDAAFEEDWPEGSHSYHVE